MSMDATSLQPVMTGFLLCHLSTMDTVEDFTEARAWPARALALSGHERP